MSSTQTLNVSAELSLLKNIPSNFTAGKTATHVNNWYKLTSNSEILNWVTGTHIDFMHDVVQPGLPAPLWFSASDTEKIDHQINVMLMKNIVEPAVPCQGQFISNVFCRPKKDGTVRIIFNLRGLNTQVEYNHFKMETLTHAIRLMTPGCFLASVDLKDAYYSIPVAASDRKFLRFRWGKQLLQFTCLPNGLSEAPRKFTKVLKVPFASLRSRGHENSAYIDDSCLVAQTFSSCMQNVHETITMLDDLGFTVHPDKSCLVPTHVLTYLGFVLDSIKMTVSLTLEKASKIDNMCAALMLQCVCTIRHLSEVIGSLVAASPGVEHAPVHYKRIEIYKNQCLQANKGNFDVSVPVTDTLREDLQWWTNNVANAERHISRDAPNIYLSSDSSDFAWGGERDGASAGGPWTGHEKAWHINVKELLAAFLTLKTFCATDCDVHVRLRLDNMTSVSYVNAQGGRKPHLNNVARTMWIWAAKHNIWLSAEHLPGILNCLADTASRKAYSTEGEWQILPSVFKIINEQFGPFQLDMFATRINTHCTDYYSWKPDPDAKAIDAFNQIWNLPFSYAFPPFSMVGPALQKLQEDQGEIFMVLPLWPTQSWFPRALKLSVDHPRILPINPPPVWLPQQPNKIHCLNKKLKLTLFHLSTNRSKVLAFHKQLPTSLVLHGAAALKSNTGVISKNGCHFVVGNKYLQCWHL